MSTRSFIGIRNEDKTITGIYCHNNGYPNWNGSILLEHYNNLDDVLNLISGGNLSVLNETVKESVYYSRDGGEDTKINAAQNYKNLFDVVEGSDYDYIYIYETNCRLWFVGSVVFLTDYHYNIPSERSLSEYAKLTDEICNTNCLPSESPKRAVENLIYSVKMDAEFKQLTEYETLDKLIEKVTNLFNHRND